MDRAVAVTGLGAITPLGNDAESTWRGLVEGRSGIRTIDTFDAETFPVQIAGTVQGFELAERVPDSRTRRHLSRAAGFGVAAALEALADAGLENGVYESHERGVALAGSVGRADLQELVDMSWTIRASEGRVFPRHRPSSVLE